MNKIQTTLATCAVAAALGSLSAQAQEVPGAALVLQAVNYNAGSGVWDDSSGNGDNATYFGTIPTLATGVTPNGSSAVDLPGTGGFNISTPVSTSTGFTVFAYIEPTVVNNGGNRFAITGGGSANSLEYNFYQGHQNWLSEYEGGGGAGTATISTSAFSLIDVVASVTGGSFDLNGAPDGTTGGTHSGSPFTPIARIGNNEGGGDTFTGDIAEIDIYNSVLTPTQIAQQEAYLTSEYVTEPVPEPTTWVMLAGGLGTLIAVRRFRRS